MRLTHFSLFTGIGGIDLAAEWAGFETIGQCEYADYQTKVLEKHWPNVLRWRDIFDVTGKEILERCGAISLLSGGLPCQPFSIAGSRKGTKDERYLWPEMLRLICETNPTWVLGENVRGLLSIDNGRVFGRILSDLVEVGYRVGWVCYGAGDIGAPHQRDRVFIVAHSRCELQQRSMFCREDEKKDCREYANQSERSGSASGNNVAHSNTEGIQRGEDSGNAYRCRKDGGKQSERQSQSTRERSSEPCMGGMFNGFPRGMDGDLKKFPAGPGAQYDWEPPRTAKGVKNRANRLKCLGNAVVPQQVYPILKAIADMEEENERI